MKRVFFVATAAFAVLAIGVSAEMQTPTIDQIIDKNIAALGGRAALEKITSRVAKGTVEVPEAGMTGTVTISEKAPDKALAVIEIGGFGTVREGATSAGAWSEDPQSGVRDKSGAELSEAKRGATFNMELKLKEVFKTLAVTGRESVANRPVWVVLATPADGAPSRLYFDAETGLLLRMSSARETPQGPMDVDTYLEDYRVTDGVKQPWVVRQVTSQATILIKLTEVKNNVPLDDAIFKRPGF
jgi:hypothetical protein